MTITFEDLLHRHGEDIAFVAEGQPATTAPAFIEQLTTAATRLSDARINGAEDWDTAATYLTDAQQADSTARAVLLTQAESHLGDVYDMVDEYRDMVGEA